jgi:hypothetical protein
MGCNFFLSLIHQLTHPKTTMAQIDDLNQDLVSQTGKIAILQTNADDLQTATNGIIARIAALPPATDLSAPIQQVLANNAAIDAISTQVQAQTAALNAQLPA